ncbi:MAG: transporter substrate-binding domain-containing protein [Lactobacillus sp.]|nr:transporter substrate-binding domain-containing protein [Lactobacillus sp.]
MATSPDFPPAEFYILKDGKKEIVGSDVALIQAIADEIGVELEIKPTDFNGVLANIQTGSVDLGIAAFVGTDERGQVMEFSDGYQQEAADGFQGLLMTKETAKKYTSLDEIKEAKLQVGAQAGSIQYELATTVTDEKKIKQFGTMDAAILALNSGDVDAITVSTSHVIPMLATFPDLEILPQENFDLDPEQKYATNVIGFPKGRDNKALIEVANKVIKENLENGNLEKWRAEYTKLAVDAIEE